MVDAGSASEAVESAVTAEASPGRYEPEVSGALGLASLTLRADSSYRAERLAACAQSPCASVDEVGEYTLSRSGGERFVTLTTRKGTRGGKYAYIVSAGEVLYLRESSGSQWYLFRRGPELPETCGGLNETATNGGCPEGYRCSCPNGTNCVMAGECQKVKLPETCGGPGVTAPNGGCPAGYTCTCPNEVYCQYAGECERR